MVRAGTRSGPLAWDVNELYVARRDPDIAATALEQLAYPAGAAGARRIFLRLRSDSDLFDAARIAGYRPVYTETEFTIESLEDATTTLDAAEPGELSELTTLDDHAAFRLYCAAVPIDVRTRSGQVLDEWASGQEPLGRKTEEFAAKDAESERHEAVVRTAELAGRRFVSLMRSRGSSFGSEAMLGQIKARGEDKPVTVMVRSYDEELGESLTDIGFTSDDSYDVMIKTLAVPVTEAMHGYAAVER